MEPAVFYSRARRRDSRHGNAVLPFYAYQGSAAKWRVGVLKADGTLDGLEGVTEIKLTIVSYGGAVPGTGEWVKRSVASEDFSIPSSPDAVLNGTEWNAEISLSSAEMTLPVSDNGNREYWFEWRAVILDEGTGEESESVLATGVVVFRGTSKQGGNYALVQELQVEQATRTNVDQGLQDQINEFNAGSGELTGRVDELEEALPGKADSTAVDALDQRTSTLEDGQESTGGRVGDLEAALPGKADTTLSNVDTFAVKAFHLAPQIVTSDKMDPALLASMGGGLDYTKNKGAWNAATNTPVIPAAAAENDGWFYYVSAPGTVATGGAPGTYVVADRIRSNGAAWELLPAPPTTIPDSSITNAKWKDVIIRQNVLVETAPGVTKLALTGEFATDGDGNQWALWFLGDDGRFWPDNAEGLADEVGGLSDDVTGLSSEVAALSGIVGPLEGFGDPNGVPVANIEGMLVTDQAYLEVNGALEQISDGEYAEVEGVKYLLRGYTFSGYKFPPDSTGSGPDPEGEDYTEPDCAIYEGEAGGLVAMRPEGEEDLFNDGKAYYGIQHANGSKWLTATNKFKPGGSLCVLDSDKRLIIEKASLDQIPETIYGILANGQSVILGTTSNPVLSAAGLYPQNSLMFNAGSQAGSGNIVLSPSSLTSFVPLIEVYSPTNNSYESPLSGAANRLIYEFNAAFGVKPTFVSSNHGYGGARLSLINKGKTPYANALVEVQRGFDLATAAGKRYVVLAVLFEHGQADENFNTGAAAYESGLRQLRADYNNDIKAITGQTEDVYLFTNQVSSWSHYANVYPGAALGQLNASINDPFVVCYGPEYFLPFKGDGVHLTNVASYRIGEYAAKAMIRTFYGTRKFEPLRPLSISQSSGEVIVEFDSEYPLAWDTANVSLRSSSYGFELTGASISGTPVIDGNFVRIPKTGTAVAAAYGYTALLSPPGAATNGGPVTGPRGNLKRLNPETSIRDTAALHDWCVHFNTAI